MLTPDRIQSRIKTVTRRVGWEFLKVGDHLRPVMKCMGLKKGEKMEPLLPGNECIEVVNVSREALVEIDREDIIKEGFSSFTPLDFILFFCSSHKGCKPGTEVTRIEFKYVKVDDR